jgi:hypothetical protein
MPEFTSGKGSRRGISQSFSHASRSRGRPTGYFDTPDRVVFECPLDRASNEVSEKNSAEIFASMKPLMLAGALK